MTEPSSGTSPSSRSGEQSAENEIDLYRKIFAGKAFQEKIAKFFASEGAIAVLEPSGSGGILHDDTN